MTIPTITIGHGDHGDVKLDIARLIVSRLLVTAASGGGKSYLLRKILEGVSLTTQTIVIDTEGDTPIAWPMDTGTTDLEQGWQGQLVRVRLRDSHGGDWSEWPQDLRVREFPAVAQEVGR